MRRVSFLLLLVPCVGCVERGPTAIPEAVELKKFLPGTHQETTDVPGLGSIKYTIQVPTNYDGKTPVPLVLALHYGYDGAKPAPYTGKEMIEAFRPGLSRLNSIVIAPDALGGGWTDTRNEQLAVWLTRSALKTYAIDRKKVVITGYSLGGEGTWFIGSRHQDLFTGAIPVAAPVDAGDAAWSIPVYVIHSDSDQVVPYGAAKKHAETLKEKGTRLEFKTVRGLNHYQTAAYANQVGEGVSWLQTAWK
jgi:predicted peptidase